MEGIAVRRYVGFVGRPPGNRHAARRRLQPDNQYKLFAAKNGVYRMCGQNGACGELDLGR